MSNKLWKETINVSSFDVGASKHLEAGALMRHFQEAAARHATQLGAGFEHLKQENIFWVLTHLHLEVERWPDMEEPISIETWPRDIEKLYTTRDFLVRDGREEIIARSTSAWIMVDINKKRPVRPTERLKDIPFMPEEKALGDFPQEISEEKVEITSEHSRKVAYSDLDINQHVNNTRYIEWIMDRINPENQRHLKELNVHFTHEFKKDQTALLKMGTYNQKEGDFFIAIDHPESGRTGVKALVKFA